MPKDYERAADLLEKLARETPPPFPRLTSGKSGRLFSRLVSGDSIALASPAGASTEESLSLLVPLLNATNRILSTYALTASADATYDEELVELLVFQFQEVQLLVRTGASLMQSLSPDDPNLAVRRDGFSQVREGLGTTVAGLVETLGELEMYRTGSRLRLATFLLEHIQMINEYIPEGVAAEMPLRLRESVSSEPDPSLREALASLAIAFTQAPRPAA